MVNAIFLFLCDLQLKSLIILFSHIPYPPKSPNAGFYISTEDFAFVVDVVIPTKYTFEAILKRIISDGKFRWEAKFEITNMNIFHSWLFDREELNIFNIKFY